MLCVLVSLSVLAFQADSVQRSSNVDCPRTVDLRSMKHVTYTINTTITSVD